MKKTLARIGAALVACSMLTGLVGCGEEEEAPPGHRVRMRIESVDPAVVDSVRVTVFPPTGATFPAQEPVSFEGGSIEMTVTDDGDLNLDIDGDYVRNNVEELGDGNVVLEIEIWTDDTLMRQGGGAPRIGAAVLRSGEIITTDRGGAFLAWPPPLDATVQLVMTCTAQAGMDGLCRP